MSSIILFISYSIYCIEQRAICKFIWSFLLHFISLYIFEMEYAPNICIIRCVVRRVSCMFVCVLCMHACHNNFSWLCTAYIHLNQFPINLLLLLKVLPVFFFALLNKISSIRYDSLSIYLLIQQYCINKNKRNTHFLHMHTDPHTQLWI